MKIYPQPQEEIALEKRLDGQLPTLDIAGDTYWVDLEKNCLRPKDSSIPKGISFNSLEKYFSWTQNTYVFTYNKLHHEPQEVDYSDLYDMPDRILLVEFPSMERLDPVGYARLHQEDISLYVKKLGIDLQHMASSIEVKETLTQLLQQDQLKKIQEKNKSPEQKALERRLKGHLPTVDINGHLFYVDLFMRCLRPKDIFSTHGIKFDKIEPNYSSQKEKYIFAYNPKTYEAETFDFNNIESIPEDILLVELPSKPKLDPVSFARMHEYNIESFARRTGIQSHFKAKIRPLKTYLLEHKESRKSKREENKSARHRRKGKGRSR